MPGISGAIQSWDRFIIEERNGDTPLKLQDLVHRV